jgi:glycosyltransferase involved in cell wall biosynthesis
MRQEGVKVELLIADGDSSDGTADICRRNRQHLAHFVCEPDRGVYDAWNKLLPHARGEWICFLGADDRFPVTDTLARLTQAALSRPVGCRLVYGRVEYFNDNGQCVYHEGAPWGDCAGEMRFRNSIPHIGTLHARAIFDEGARFDTAYRIAGDYDLVRREALRNGAFFAADVVAAHAAWGGLSTRAELELQSVREVGRIIRRQDGRHPPAVWYWRCGKVLVRHAIYRTLGASGLRGYEQFKSLAKRKAKSAVR